MPGGVEGVGAVEHAEIIGLAPHDHLASETQCERDLCELNIAIRLAKNALETQGVRDAWRQIGKCAISSSCALIRNHFLPWPRLKVVDTIIHAAIQPHEVGATNPRKQPAVK